MNGGIKPRSQYYLWLPQPGSSPGVLEQVPQFKVSSGSKTFESIIAVAACKVHDFTPMFAPDAVPYKRETYTIWMRSLIMHGYGCTVFDKNGEIVYRVDNYEKKCCSKVFLMDRHGKLLFTIIRRKLRVFSRWEGYRCDKSTASSNRNFCFQVRRGCGIFSSRKLFCEVLLRLGRMQRSCYTIEGLIDKSEFRVIDREGEVIAEVKRKESSSGVCLGEDVLALSVEAEADPSLIVSLVAVYGSICCRM